MPAVKVPLLDLKPQYQALKAELDAALLRVAESQYFILGPEVKALEAATAAYSGCKFGIGISSVKRFQRLSRPSKLIAQGKPDPL